MDQDAIQHIFGRLHPGVILDKTGGRPLAIVPIDHKAIDLEPFADNPQRTRRKVTLSDSTSFFDYIERLKDDSSVVFVSPSLASISASTTIATCIFDYDTQDVPHWGDHTVGLQAKPSIAYAKLQGMNNKLFEQPDFAKAIKELSRFATSPQPADLLEIAHYLVLSSKGEFVNINDEISGSVDLTYKVKVTAAVNSSSENRKLVVPEYIDFVLPLIEGSAPQHVRVEFLYRVPASSDAKLSLGLRIVDKDYIEEEALLGVVTKIREQTGLPVFLGETTRPTPTTAV